MAAEEGAPPFLVTPRDEDSQRLIGALQKLYRQKLRPVEEAFSFGRFHYDAITDTELEAKSQVLVIGQYSTGKTTFIRHLLGADFPNMNIGPEPTTDKFTVVIHGEEDRPVEGNSLAVIKELPYEGLTRFGTGFLNKLDAAISTSPFLENITLVDTPGVLSGEMQMHQRDYNFADVARWFADRSDMILILFDAHRLDVSDELMEILMRLKDHQGIIRIVLNKADQVDRAKLRRVYGALMWSMGKVFDNPEVVRVYVGSFWEKPLRHTAHQQLFKADQDTLTRELTDLPRLSAIRKINQLIKRTNIVRAHACVLSYLNEQTPWMFGRDRRREDLLTNLKGVLETVRARHGLHAADMPDVDALRANLQSFDFASFPTLTRATLRQLNDVVDVDIHKVLKEGGGSEKIFKFSRNRSPPPRPGLLSRAGSSVFNLLGVGGATPSASPPTAATRVTPPVSGVGTSRRVEMRSASEGTSAQQARRSDAGRGEEGSSKGGVGTGRDLERNKQGAQRWTCRFVLQVLLLVFITLAFLVLALDSIGVTSGGPLHFTKKIMTNQATGFLSPKRAIGAVRRLVGNTVEREGGPGEGTGDSIPEEVEALYRGTVH